MNHKNIIEINGKKYDPKSGVLLTSQTHKTVDGIIKTKASNSSVHVEVNTSSHKPNPASRAGHNPVPKRVPQKSQTLMRKSVSKPTNKDTSGHAIHGFKRSRNESITTKSPYVTRHASHPKPIRIERKEEDLDVAPLPSATHKTTPHHNSQKKHSDVEQLFEQALAAAPLPGKRLNIPKSKARRLGRLASITASALLLVGLFAYMNYGQIQMRIASNKAGFDANTPTYTAAGYSLEQPIDSKPGTVSFAFRSNTDQRNYTLKQEVSGWNSTSLQENYLKAQNISYNSIQEGGRTIFLYDKTNATWVNGGVWYQIDSDSLSTDQLVKVASSL